MRSRELIGGRNGKERERGRNEGGDKEVSKDGTRRRIGRRVRSSGYY